MIAIRRILSGGVFLLGFIGLLIAFVLIGLLWHWREPFTAQVDAKLVRIQLLLEKADRGLREARSRLDRSLERLQAAVQARENQETRPAATKQWLARTIQQQVAPEITNAQMAIQTVAEAAYVAHVLLEDVGEWSALAPSKLDFAQLEPWSGRLAGLAASTWDMSRLFSNDEHLGDDESLRAGQARVTSTVANLYAFLAEQEPRLNELRLRTDQARTKLQRWSLPGAWMLTAVLTWLAFAHLCVLHRGRTWWLQAAAAND